MTTDSDRLYTRPFFQVFAATGFFMTGVALQFHFAQYIDYLGHDVETLGRLLGVSTVGTLLIRLHLGRWIDRFGCRFTWLVGTVLVAALVGSMQFAERLWLIAAVRTLSQMAVAMVMTTVAVFAALIAPPGRRAESLGTVGLAGFLGMMLGSSMGDWIFSGDTESMLPYRVFFTVSALCSLLAGAIMLTIPLAPRPQPCPPPDGTRTMPASRDSALRVIRTHWPGTILVVGVVFSMVFCLQLSFLERLAESRGFKDIKMFFLIYGPTAITLRLIFRRVPERLGRTRTLWGGLLILAAGVYCLVGVQSEWDLILPAFLMGTGHCFVFPSMIDLAAERLPLEHRGTGTSLILGAGDLGLLVGFVGLGELIDGFGFDVALTALASTVLAGALLLGWTRRRDVFLRGRRSG